MSNFIGIIIDYRATYMYVYGIGNRRALPKEMHWAALKHSPKYLQCSACKD